MALNAKALEQLEQDLAAARDRVAGYQIDSTISDDAQLIAAAIIQFGAQISLAVAAGE